MPSKRKAKGKGKRQGSPSRIEKEKAAVDKAATALKHSVDRFRVFVDKTDNWLLKNRERALRLFQAFDVSGTGKVTHDQFKAGLRDLSICCDSTELHLLCTLLDKNNSGMIDYNVISTGLSYIRDKEEQHRIQDIRPVLQPNHPKFLRCNVCNLLSWDGEPYRERFPRYHDVTLRLLTFDGSRNHPAHIRKLVYSHITVLNLIKILLAETSTVASHVAIYPDRSADSQPLPEEQSLEQCGYIGGPRNMPNPLLLYYDYSVEIGSGCPIVMCDHYFGQRKARVHRSASAVPGRASAESSLASGGRELTASHSVLSVGATTSLVTMTSSSR